MSASGLSALRYWIIWFVLTCALLVLVPAVKFGAPPWLLPAKESLPFLIFFAGFFASAAIPALKLGRRNPAGVVEVLLWVVAIFGLLFTALTLTGLSASRVVFLGVLAVAVVLLPLSFSRWRMPRFALVVIVAAVGLAFAASLYTALGPVPATPVRDSSFLISTGAYNVTADVYEGRIARPAARGGDISRIADQFLLSTGDGYLYLFGWRGEGNEFSIKSLPYRIPLNGDEFARSMGVPYEQPRQTIALSQGAGDLVETYRFHVSGILVQERGEQLRLFAGHHYWKADQQCYVVRVSLADVDREPFLNGTAKPVWSTLYESTPCLPVEGGPGDQPPVFEGNTSGGRLSLRDPDTLVFTVGFHRHDGVSSKRLYGQDPQVSWGTTVLIHVNEKTSETFTLGHRNPQGLYIDPQGGIWETEHGPRGGDELNYLEQGKNYGWPYVSYGTAYGTLTWPLDKTGGRHDGFEKPVYAWLPSIAVSQLIGLEKDLFPAWKGDLLVASLTAASLYRFRLDGHRVVYSEPMEIGRRIRTVIEGQDGRLVLWTDDAAIVSLRPASGSSPELLFANKCGGCHAAANGLTHMIGPDLGGVHGRQVAAAQGFEGYTPALRNIGGRWDDEKLDKFLLNPQAMAPGSTMTYEGVPDAQERAQIIAYLKARK